MRKDVSSGDVVVSTAGKDKDKRFLVIDKKDGFLYLVDGKSRRQLNPKKKSVKHVKVIIPQGQVDLAEEINKGNLVGAKRIKSALAKQKNIGG